MHLHIKNDECYIDTTYIGTIANVREKVAGMVFSKLTIEGTHVSDNLRASLMSRIRASGVCTPVATYELIPKKKETLDEVFFRLTKQMIQSIPKEHKERLLNGEWE